MQQIATPEPATQFERLRVAAALQRAKRTLLARPAPAAPELAQGILFPLLQALKFDVFDLETLRLQGAGSPERAIYKLNTAGAESGSADRNIATFEILAANDRLQDAEEGVDGELFLATNGRRWRAVVKGVGRIDLDLLDAGFAEALHELLLSQEDLETRLEGARETLRARRVTTGRATLGGIGIDEVRGHAELVRNLRGALEASFDGQPLSEVSSRSAFYFVLASLALEHGREDAIPSGDLIRPPEEPPQSRRTRPLSGDGWHLILDHDPQSIERRTAALLDSLQLSRRFEAKQHGRTYPSSRLN